MATVWMSMSLVCDAQLIKDCNHGLSVCSVRKIVNGLRKTLNDRPLDLESYVAIIHLIDIFALSFVDSK